MNLSLSKGAHSPDHKQASKCSYTHSLSLSLTHTHTNTILKKFFLMKKNQAVHEHGDERDELGLARSEKLKHQSTILEHIPLKKNPFNFKDQLSN